MRTLTFAVAISGLLLAGCGSKDEGEDSRASAAADTPTRMKSPVKAAEAAKSEGFDPAAVPVSTASLGDFPFFGLMDGYAPMTKANYFGSPVFEFVSDSAFDRYEMFDGYRIVPLEGRTRVTNAMGSGASFFQVQKNYEKLVHDLGGVTVFEGRNGAIKDKGLKFDDPRFRNRYYDEEDKLGVYMIRRPDRQVWVEVYKPAESEDESYWLTVVETVPLKVTSNLIPASELKTALDTSGHVAIPVLFDTDKATLKPASGPVIDEVVKLMKGTGALRLSVEGHTDDQGSAAHNRTLSQARADAVMRAIVANGIDGGRLTAKGFGADKPVASNADEAGRAQNRRVELVKR